jgi:glutathione S-transferase
VHDCGYCTLGVCSSSTFLAPGTDRISRWVTAAFWAGIDIDEFPALKAWDDRMLARPGVEKGRHVPDPHRMKELSKNPEEMKEQAEKSRAWVQQGMAADSKK